jgi:hypothetical protein
MKCFLNGNHEGHKVICRYSENASCDCGDESLWKKEGFCKHHQGSDENPDQTDLSPDLRSQLISCFALVLNSLGSAMDNSNQIAVKYLFWIKEKIAIGDAVRRCFVIALDKVDIFKLIFRIVKLIPQVSGLFGSIFSDISNDTFFKENIAIKLADGILTIYKFFKDQSEEAINNDDEQVLGSIKEFSRNIFHWFSASTIQLIRAKIDYQKIFNEILDTYVNMLLTVQTKKFITESRITSIISNFQDIIKIEDNKETIKKFGDEFIRILAKYEGCRPFTRKFGEKSNDSKKITIMIHNAAYIFATIIMHISTKNFYNPYIFDAFANWIKENKDKELQQPMSVLKEETGISIALEFHVFLSRMLTISGEPSQWLHHIANKAGMSIDDLCNAMICSPMKTIAASRFAFLNLFVRNCSSDLVSLISLCYKENLPNRYLPLFVLIQYCVECCTDKKRIMETIARIMGVFDEGNEEEHQIVSKEFFIFALNIAIDRTFINNDKEKIIEALITTTVKGQNPLLYEELVREIPSFQMSGFESNAILNRAVKRVCSSVNINGQILFKESDSASWNVIQPGIKRKQVDTIIGAFSSKNKDIPYTLQLQEGYPKLLEVLETPVMRAIALKNSSKDDIIFNQLINAYLIIESKRTSALSSGGPQKFQYVSTESFCAEAAIDFATFINSTITIADKEYCIKTGLGKNPLGQSVLRQMGISVDISDSERELQRKRNKERAALARKAALEAMNTSMSQFADDVFEPENNNEEEETCSICQTKTDDVPLYYQGHIALSCVASLVDKVEIDSAALVNICPHTVHKACSDVDGNGVYQCPLDRSLKNTFIPFFDTSFDKDLDIKSIEGMDNFLADYRKYCGKITLVNCAKTIGSMITIIEARDRKDPLAVSSASNGIIFKLLSRLFWKFVDDEDAEEQDISKLSLTIRFVHRLLSSDDPIKSFQKLVQDMYSETSASDAIPFLRRCQILEKYLTEPRISQEIDFDEILEYENLCKHFGVAVKECEPLTPASIIKAPRIATSMFNENFDEETFSFETPALYSLFDGEIIGVNNIEAHSLKYKLSFNPYILLTGKLALAILINVPMEGFLKRAPPIYTTEMGQLVVGWEANDQMILNQDRLHKLENDILSASF